MTEIRCRKACFCSGERVRQSSNISCCSAVSSTRFPSAKNCARVMPKPLQICSSVATDGVVLRLKMFATVDWDSPDSIASRYSLQFSSVSNSRMRCFVSNVPSPMPFLLYFISHLNGIVVGLCIDIDTQERYNVNTECIYIFKELERGMEVAGDETLLYFCCLPYYDRICFSFW